MKFYGIVGHPDNFMRHAVIRVNGLTPEQQQLQRLQDCYSGTLFDSDSRTVTWGQKIDDYGEVISKERWKPIYVPPLAEEIVKRHVDELFGGDAFPDFEASPSSEIHSEIQERTLDEVQKQALEDQEKEIQRQLQSFVNELVDQSDLEVKAYLIGIDTLVLGKKPVSIKFVGGKPEIDATHDRKFCSWKYAQVDYDDNGIQRNNEEIDPNKVVYFREQYPYDEFDELEGKNCHYWYRYEIDEAESREWRIRVSGKDAGKIPNFAFHDHTTYMHNLGFCPVVIFSTPDGKSIFSDRTVSNFEGYIESYNNVLAGLDAYSNPQPILLDKSDSDLPVLNAGNNNRKPLRRGGIWKLRGDSLVTLSSDTSGHKTYMEKLSGMEMEIKSACRMIDVNDDNNQSGKAVEYRLKPQLKATQQYRTSLGKGGLKPLVEMLVRSAMIKLQQKYRLKIKATPPIMSVDITLLWGDLMPITEDKKIQALDVTSRMIEVGFSRHSALKYSASLVGVESLEDDRVEKQTEDEQNNLSMIDSSMVLLIEQLISEKMKGQTDENNNRSEQQPGTGRKSGQEIESD